MKNVLFIGVTNYNLRKEKIYSHLKKKFEGLSQGAKVFVLAKGKPWCKKIWGTEFYLLPKNPFFWPLVFFLGFYLCLRKKIDTIVCQSPLMDGFIGTLLKKLLKKELIVEIHGDWIDAPFLYKERTPKFFYRKLYEALGKFSLKNADKIRAISNFTKKLAQAYVTQKPIFVFPTFTDIDFFLEPTNVSFNNFILFVGYLHRIKGVEYLIEAFSRIANEFSGFRLIIIGDGPELNNLKLQIANCKLEDKVEFKGKLSLTEVKEVMRGCYLLVLPSLSEGLGLVLMEAMALGKPVIGSKVGGILDLIRDGQNGFLVDPRNSDQLAEKIKILLSNKNLALEMGRRGREFVMKNFSNEKYIKSYIDMINA